MAANFGDSNDLVEFPFPSSSVKLFASFPEFFWGEPLTMMALRPRVAKEVMANELGTLLLLVPCPEPPPYVLPMTPRILESMKPDSSDARKGRKQGMQAVIIERHWTTCLHIWGVTASQLRSGEFRNSGIDARRSAEHVQTARRLPKTLMTVNR